MEAAEAPPSAVPWIVCRRKRLDPAQHLRGRRWPSMKLYPDRPSRSTTGGADTPTADEPLGPVHTFARLHGALDDGDHAAAKRYRRALLDEYGYLVIPPARWGRGGRR